MLLKQFFESDTSSFTYLIGNTKKKLAALIDPVVTEIDIYLAELQKLDLQLIYVLDTHTHADHISANGQLRDITGCQTLMAAQAKSTCIDQALSHGDEINLGDIRILAIHTPGHTDDSFCFYIAQDQGYLFTGDTLLINGSGRTDFQNGDANDQYNSIFKVLLQYPDHTLVYPGHDYNSNTVSTIGREKLNNPRLQLKDRTSYVEFMRSLKLPNPKYMDIAVPANRACGKEK